MRQRISSRRIIGMGENNMKLFRNIILILLLISVLASCNTTTNEQISQSTTSVISDSATQVTEVKNVTIRISNVSPIGATVVIKDTNNPPYLYGSWYMLEKQTNGTWQAVDAVIENYAFDTVGYMTDTNHEVTFEINWEWLYGVLTTGHYRLIKESGGNPVAVEFDI